MNNAGSSCVKNTRLSVFIPTLNLVSLKTPSTSMLSLIHSEKNGGVHQICIKNISENTPNFSKLTGQTDWSNNRGNDNHCVCLGAWSLYNSKKKTNKTLKCNAIPKIALTDRYVSKFSEGWNKWNGLELPNQIKYGVESLVENCMTNEPKSKNLKKNYCRFARKHKSLKNSNLYSKHCN